MLESQIGRVRSRSDCMSRSAHAQVGGVVRHSWFSSAFTRAKGAITAAVSFIPVIGGGAARAIEGIHTGDEHQDASGQWVSNSTGAATIGPRSAAIQSEIDRVAEFNRQELERLRQTAADTAARLGAGLTLEAAARIGPEGNIYQRTLNNPLALAGGAVAVVLIIVLLFWALSRGRK